MTLREKIIVVLIPAALAAVLFLSTPLFLNSQGSAHVPSASSGAIPTRLLLSRSVQLQTLAPSSVSPNLSSCPWHVGCNHVIIGSREVEKVAEIHCVVNADRASVKLR
jgi:hypothetical protein